MRLLILLSAAIVSPLPAATEWLKITSANFEMYTTAGAKEGRRTLEYFEQVRDFFMRIRSQQAPHLPVTIIAFRNSKEYKPYSPRETAAAYYTGDEQRDYIVLPGAGEQYYRAAVHEYMHLLIRHSGMKLPVWLNEGIAEVHSTMKPYGGKILVGSPIEGSANALAQRKWYPIRALLGIRQDAPEFNERDRTGVFYAQSWLLTHMLMLGEAYNKDFGRFSLEVSNSGSAEGALQKIYGRTPEEVERDLRSYFRGTSVKAALFDLKLQKMEVSEPRPASELESGLTLAKLTGLLRRQEEAERRMDDLAKAHPESWEIQEAIAHLHWQRGDLGQAREKLRRAVELKSPSWKTHWDYARLSQGEPEVLDALKTTLRLNPAMADARLMLGFELYKARQFKEAYETLSSVKRVTPDRAPSFFLAKGFSALQTGNKADARSAAESAKKYAKLATDLSAADEILRFIDRPDAQAEAPAISAPERPMTAGEARGETPQDLDAVRGVLQEIECLGKEARLHILAGQITMKLLIRDPERVQLKNSKSGSVQMTCGPQQNTRVFAEYVAKEDAQFQTSGDVLTLHLQ